MKTIIYLALLLVSISMVIATEDCGDGIATVIDNVEIGENIYLVGQGFKPDCITNWIVIREYNETIEEKMIGYVKTSSEGEFSVPIMTVISDEDIGNFTAIKFYYGNGHVSSPLSIQSSGVEIPEFTNIGYGLSVIGALSIFMITKKKK